MVIAYDVQGGRMLLISKKTRAPCTGPYVHAYQLGLKPTSNAVTWN